MKNNKSNGNQSKTAVVYSRVSTVIQLDNTSLDSQEAACIKHAQELGYTVEKVVREQHTGKDIEERPLLSDVRADIRAGKYNGLVVYATDRLGRNNDERTVVAYDIRKHGAQVISVTENFDDSIIGRFLPHVYGLVAEIELDKIRERTVRGKKTKFQQGKFVPASNLYGYDFDRENARRIINPKESLIVRRIFEMYLSDKGSIRGIYKTLNDENIDSPATGKRKLTSAKYTNQIKHGRTFWNKGAITRILNEPAYKGHTIAWRNKTESGFENGKRFSRIKIRDESEWIEMPDGTTPAIITPEQFKAVRAKLDTNKGESTRNEMRPELLRGLVFCGDCGRKLYPETEVKRAKAYERKIYRCPSRSTIKCNGKAINADKCESAVWAKVCDIIKKPHLIAAEMERRKADTKDDRQKIESELVERKSSLARIESEITNLVSRSATVDESIWEIFQQQLKIKTTEKKKNLESIGEIENRLASFDADTQAAKALAEFSNRVSQNLEEFGFDEKRLTLEALNVKITGNGKEFRLDVSMPTILEKQVNETNHSDDRVAGIG